MSTDHHKHHTTPVPIASLCEGCGGGIAKGEARYHVLFGTFADTFEAQSHQAVYYHKEHLDPYVIMIWLQTYEAVLIALSPSLA